MDKRFLFLPILVGIIFQIYLFSHLENAYAQQCFTIDSGTTSFAGDTAICGPNKHINITCDKAKGGFDQKTGNDCCTERAYDTCAGSISNTLKNGQPALIGNSVSYTWKCCFNPTPTPTPTPSCSNYGNCSTCISGAPFTCGWNGSSCQSGTSFCPQGTTTWNFFSCAQNLCAPTPTGGPTPTPTPTPSCSGFLSCGACQPSDSCGWCFSSSQCKHGSSFGSDDGLCTGSNWGFFSCNVPTPTPTPTPPPTPTPT